MAMWAGFTLTLRGLCSVFIAVHDPTCVGSARRCADTSLWAKVALSLSVVWCSCSLPNVFPSLPFWWQDARVGARITAMWEDFRFALRGVVLVCSLPCEFRVGVQIRLCGHGFCFRSTWFAGRVFIAVLVCRFGDAGTDFACAPRGVGARVFIAVLEVRVGRQIRRCGHGLRSDRE